ncbi:MAG: methyltransferase domain-containing protein [Anaerotignum sp.]|nr:methyltransferase domain-containing protein [Anaerotignum sp.]
MSENGLEQLHDCGHNRFHRGPSSFFKHDSSLVFEKLALQKGDALLDLGCGAGDYSIYGAKIVGETGCIYALERYQETLNHVCNEAQNQGIKNIHPVVSDIRRQIAMADSCVDACLIATVLHIIDFSAEETNLFPEVRRVLKPQGKLTVIECKKESSPFGPPVHLRISPEELEKMLGEYGFLKTDYIDLGFNYMMLFTLNH